MLLIQDKAGSVAVSFGIHGLLFVSMQTLDETAPCPFVLACSWSCVS